MSLGIFPPYQNILNDLQTKLNTIVVGIKRFDIGSIHDMQTFTSQFTKVRNEITKELNVLNNIHAPQAQNSLNTAIAAKDQGTVARVIKLIKDIVDEINSAIKCITLIGTIIITLIAIPAIIVTKLVELVLHAIMMAEQACLDYLKQLENDIMAELNKIKNQMLAYIKQQQGAIVITGITTSMKIAETTLNSLNPLNPNSNPNQVSMYNSVALQYNYAYCSLLEINDHATYGNIDINIYTQQTFGKDLSDLSIISTV